MTTNVSPNLLMLRNPEAFEVWSACSRNAHHVITKSEMLPFFTVGFKAAGI